MKKLSLAELVKAYSKLPEQETNGFSWPRRYTSKKLQKERFMDFDYCLDLIEEGFNDLDKDKPLFVDVDIARLAKGAEDSNITYADGDACDGYFHEILKMLQYGYEYQKEVNRTLVKELNDLSKEVKALKKCLISH